MIRLEGVSKRFGDLVALHPLDLTIQEGEWLGLFGHNGSGKTTLLRILLGLARPTEGCLLIDGKIPDQAAWLAFRSRFGFMPERISFYEHLTGCEMLGYLSRLRGAEPGKVMPTLESVGLLEAAGRRVREYSKGMRQRLNLAQALLGDPDTLIMDEPIEGLDPGGVRTFFDLLGSGQIKTVVISSHRLSEVCSRVDRACILNQGMVRAYGTVGELIQGLKRPARVHIYPAVSANGTLESVLKGLNPTNLTHKNGKWVAEVPQTQKIAFLTALDRQGNGIDHLHIEEPSLEEVYFETD